MKELNLITEDFLETVESTKNLSPKTIIAYRSDLNDFGAFLQNNTLSEEIVLSYIHELSQKRNLKDTTISRKLIVLKMFFAYLYSQKYIESDYFNVHSFKYKKEKRLPKTLSVKETAKLLASLTNLNTAAQSDYELWKTTRNLAMIDVLISTGIRIAELSNISINDIISAERVVLIHGKGRKQRLIYISCPQTWANLMQ